MLIMWTGKLSIELDTTWRFLNLQNYWFYRIFYFLYYYATFNV